MPHDKLRDRLDKLTNTNRVATEKIIGNIYSFELEHEQYLRKEYGRFCSQFELYHTTTISALHHLNYKDRADWRTYKGLQFMFTANAQKSLGSAYRLLLSGFYDDTVTVLRYVYEIFLRILFVSMYSDHQYNALVRKPPKGPRFNATAIVEDQLKLDWRHYSVLSNFAHSNAYRVYETMDKNQDKDNPQPITVRYDVDDDMIGLCTNYFQFLSLVQMWLATKHLNVRPEALSENIKLRDLHTTAQECISVMQEVLATHTSSPYWRIVAKDLQDIFALISTLDKDISLDWESAWRHIRNPE